MVPRVDRPLLGTVGFDAASGAIGNRPGIDRLRKEPDRTAQLPPAPSGKPRAVTQSQWSSDPSQELPDGGRRKLLLSFEPRPVRADKKRKVNVGTKRT
jgi:hypothetical protein